MKLKIITLLIFLLSNFSKAQTTTNSVYKGLKCLFNDKKTMNNIENVIELFFSNDSRAMIKALTLLSPIKDCFGLNITGLISSTLSLKKETNDVILNQVKNYDAPIVLRKYIYDYANNNGMVSANEECQKITEQEPYVNYKKICNLLI